MSKTVRTSPISPPPGQQDQSARLAASAEVGQVEGINHNFYDREDGLAHCKVCGGAEGSLPTHCPGVRMSADQEEAVYAASLDFLNGHWTGQVA